MEHLVEGVGRARQRKWSVESFDCSYCGQERADTLDHVIPFSFARVRRRKNSEVNRAECVPCCRECNNLLSNLLYLTVGERAAYLATALRGRYAGVLAVPEWDSDELAAVSERMAASIRGARSFADLVRLRIEHCQQVAALCPSIPDVWGEN